MKSILVHLDASPRAAQRLRIARDLADAQGAEVTALYGVLPSLLTAPWALDAGDPVMAETIADLERTQFERARRTFEASTGAGPLHWGTAEGPDLQARLRDHCLYHDLLVLGQFDAQDGLQGSVPADLVPSLLADSGKPALVIPSSGSFSARADTVLLGWKPTREAARAIAAAWPWLVEARQLHVACGANEAGEADDALPRLQHWLRLHGAVAPIRVHRLAADDVGDALLSLAADVGADLLVMGCYGHARAREWILGGATRTVLQTMTLPVLMSH